MTTGELKNVMEDMRACLYLLEKTPHSETRGEKILTSRLLTLQDMCDDVSNGDIARFEHNKKHFYSID